MEYDGGVLNVVQEYRVINDFFSQNFGMDDGVVMMEAWIAKRMEDTDGEFLCVTQEDIGCLRAELKNMIRELDVLDIEMSKREVSE